MRSFPPDVLMVTHDEMRHARFVQKGKTALVDGYARTTFSESPFDSDGSPGNVNTAAIRTAVERLRARRKFDRASILLPDSWFRTHIVDVESLPESRTRQEEAVRWVLRKSVPNRQEKLRIAWNVIDRSAGRIRLVVLTAPEKSLGPLEAAVRQAGVTPILIEPTGINLWNAVATGEPDDEEARLLITIESAELSMILFRGSEPVFVRSKRVSDLGSLTTELRLSASYLRTQQKITKLARIWLTGDDATEDLARLIERELGSEVERPGLSDLGIETNADIGNAETSVMAAMGVFAA